MTLLCIELHDEWEDKEHVVEFDFLGKDSVRYWNFVPVEKKVSENTFLLVLAFAETSFAAFTGPTVCVTLA